MSESRGRRTRKQARAAKLAARQWFATYGTPEAEQTPAPLTPAQQWASARQTRAAMQGSRA